MSAPVFDQQYRRERVGFLRAKLAESGCRITPQRIAVLDALLNGLSHPTAEEIHVEVLKVSPTTSLATVYKTLDTLKALGEVQELDFGGGRAHYDGVDPVSHPHVVCTRCGRIEDVRLGHGTMLIDRASESSGYRLSTERLEFFGLCPGCREPA